MSSVSSLSIEDHKQYSLVCYTENFSGFSNLVTVDNFCREHKVGYVLAETLGAAGYVFVDFGTAHIVTDHDGEATKSFIVVSISNEEES